MSLTEELEPIFYPRAVVIVGASNREGNFGRFFLEGFVQMGFEPLYVVHPREREVLGLKVYSSVGDVPHPLDLALIFSPVDSVPQLVMECTEKGIKGVVIFTAGFGEKGDEGRSLERAIVDIAHRGQTRIIGPNCQGIYCPASRVTHFIGLSTESGTVGMISHSGSLSTILPMMSIAQGIRFSKVVSCGNECDLNAVDFLEYLGQDAETKIIIAYLEGVKDGRRFCQLARSISKEKPVIVWKGGVTEDGARAAFSHTGALAGSHEVWNAALAQTGIIGASSAEDMLDFLQTFYYLPLPRGRRVAIVSGPGGPAVAAADDCIESGLELAPLSSHTRRIIAEVIPPVGTSTDNPVDLGMGSGFSPQWYIESMKALGEDEQVDMLLIIGGSWLPNFGEMVLEAVKGLNKPAAFVSMGPMPIVSTKGFAVYTDVSRAAQALGRLWQYKNFVEGL